MAKSQGGRKCWYFSGKLLLGITTGLDTDHGFPTVTPGLDNLQSILHCVPATRETKRMENKIIQTEELSSRDISPCIGLLGLLCGSLSLILIILCLARSAKTKSVAALESKRRGGNSCKILVLEPPPPYCSLADCQSPPSYQSATVRKIWGRTRKTIDGAVSQYQLPFTMALWST